jgi:plastocyanin
MLHHIVFAALGKANPMCQTFTGFDSRPYPYGNVELFYGAGEERNVLQLPQGYGYQISKSQPYWGMVWMLMNHRGVSDHAFIRYTVTWADASDNLTGVHPYWLDVRNCHADPVFDVPGGGKKGSTYKQTYNYTMPESGRIVAGGGHVHGGAKNLVVSEPDCKNRTIFTSTPAWGTRANPFYHVRPILHEPGPISMSGFLSQKGYPIAQGQQIRLTANYDNQRPHTRVMGISMVYVAPQTVPAGCSAPPTDAQSIQPAQVLGVPYRKKTPTFVVPLTSLDPNGSGRAISVKRPSGKTVTVKSGSTIDAVDTYFTKANVAVTQGATLNWDFAPSTLHNVTLANGPRGFSSPNLSDGRTFKFHFTKPGTYRLFCALHPVGMIETVTVRKKH